MVEDVPVLPGVLPTPKELAPEVRAELASEACWDEFTCALSGLASTTQIVTPARLACPSMDWRASLMSVPLDLEVMPSEKYKMNLRPLKSRSLWTSA